MIKLLKDNWYLFAIFVLVIGLFISYQYLMYGYFIVDVKSVDITKKAQFGDSYGALSSLFNGLAFAGLIITIILQKRELSAQNKEFKDMNENHHEMIKITAQTNLVVIYQDRLDRNEKKYIEHVAKYQTLSNTPKNMFENENLFLMNSRDSILDYLEDKAGVPRTSKRIKSAINKDKENMQS